MQRPVDFTLDIKSPIEQALQGFQAGTAIRQQREKSQQLRQKQQRAEQLQTDLAALASNPNATGEDFSRISIKYPELSEQIKRSFDLLNTEQQQSKIEQASQVFSALESGDTETATELLETQKQAALNAGLQDEANKADVMLKQIENNPEAAKLSTRLALSTVMGPQKFADTFKALAERKGDFRVLSPKEKKEIGLDASKSFQISSEGKITSIGGGGVNVNIDTKGKFGPIPPGWLLKEDKKTGAFTMEPIKGSPAEQKIKDIARQKVERKELTEVAANVVSEDIGRLKQKIKGASFISPVTGAIAGRIAPTFRQSRVDAEALKTTIASNIGFDRLQQMRTASPTGGALGNVSDREVATLQAVLGSLDLNQSEKQVLKNLDRLDKIYKNILKKANAYPNAEQFGFGKESDEPSVTDEALEDILNKYRGQ